VRYRVDGDLHTSVILPISAHRALVARIKVLASIRLDEQRKPQDGRFSATIDNRPIDFRVSTFPSYNGEKVVIRILDREQGFIPLDQIGLSPRNLAMLRKAAQAPHGLVLISGPTGSGKSTTLYSMLTEIDRERKNVLSLEDPIEYYVDGVNQSQMRPEIGYTFATGLRTTLRQDPDVIMVGEIRDGETAKLAIQAALTGHLVLSTIHTNDAVGTIPRLIDMGVEPFLIPPVLICSVAQRLVRTLCPGSGKEVPLSPSDKKSIEEQLQSLPQKDRFELKDTVYEPERTATCPTGMRGRRAVFEVLEMNAEIERIVLENPVDSKIWAAARKQGMLTMKEDAIDKAFKKEIPFSEVTETKKGQVLLLDDDKFLLDMYSMKFTQQGYTVRTATTTDQALTMLHEGFVPNVILFDMTMPEKDGFAFLEALKEIKLPKTSLKIALSNQNSDEEKNRAKSLGADQYLIKANLIPSEVVNTVEGIISKKGDRA
jgi:type IV pilus assembly protein PilB